MRHRLVILIALLLLPGMRATAQEQARIRVYRTQTFIADLMTFEIAFNNSFVLQPAVNTRAEIAVNPGKIKITAKSPKNSNLTLQAEAGKMYYVRSNSILKNGNVVIELLLMDEAEGETEFSAIASDIVTQPQPEPVQQGTSRNLLSTIDSQHSKRAFEIGAFGGGGVRTGDIAYSYYLAELPTPPCIDYGMSVFMNFHELWAVGAVASMQTAFTYNGPANIFFTGAGASTRHFVGADLDAWIEGGILLGWQHASEQLPKQYGSTVMVPRSGNTIAPMAFVSYSKPLTDHLVFDAGIRMTICEFSHYSETDPDTRTTEKKENNDYGLPPTLTVWCANIGLKYILQ